ncbi:hypothetical protein [Sulfuricurvum sp.]|uniref:hypothetical protein n=1 Tax=Sulfuricurvum sp. TaxID=2025608 RepID=UPI002E3155ED|nr:hypothetical protein [Sulfuricurvum sp.]HEX5329286.1 hypothetical protein [Sulfuricurvum sp.]
MRSAMAMIEMIFAIVIIAISVMTIPSMMSIADSASKGVAVDEDVLKRLSGEITKVSQARWDQNSIAPEFYPLLIAGDIQCDRIVGGTAYRLNPDSSMPCSTNVPLMAAAPGDGNLNLTQGIEQLHNRTYNLEVNATNDGKLYTIPITYNVSYVTATTSALNAAGVATATWRLGSSGAMNPTPSVAQTHLKRVVVRTESSILDTNMTLTFFKSNVGKFAE